MPSSVREPVTVIALNFEELHTADAALWYSAHERDDLRAREKATKLAMKLLDDFEEEIRAASPRRTGIRLIDSEYGTLLEALEFTVAMGRDYPEILEKAFALWERLLVEGGHVTSAKLQALRRRYGR